MLSQFPDIKLGEPSGWFVIILRWPGLPFSRPRAKRNGDLVQQKKKGGWTFFGPVRSSVIVH